MAKTGSKLLIKLLRRLWLTLACKTLILLIPYMDRPSKLLWGVESIVCDEDPI